MIDAMKTRLFAITLVALAATLTAQPRTIPGFTPTGSNPQGRAEYRHDATGIVFILVPGGTFRMGSPEDEEGRFPTEGPLRTVTVKPFLLAKTELTQGAWRAAMKSAPWRGVNYARWGESFPATDISWDDTQAFCKRTGLRAPSEAEWEYACRAGTTTRFSYGDDETILGDYAWIEANTWDIGERYVRRVASKKPNPWGFYDMHGHVWEWCEDHWHPNYEGAPADGSPRLDSKARVPMRVQRGGSWLYGPWNCRSASRIRNVPGFRNGHLGFRPACSVP